jgi:hypothetical protein
MIISLFMGTPEESRRVPRVPGAHVGRDGRKRGSQPDGQRQPQLVDHRRNLKRKFWNPRDPRPGAIRVIRVRFWCSDPSW